MSEPRPYAGLVLAAGRSSRMEGGSKLLAGLGGSSVLRRVVSTARAADLDPIFVVVAGSALRLRQDLAGEPVRFVSVVPSERGRLASIAAGLEAIRPCSVDGVAILLGDEPGLRADHLRTVVHIMRSAPEDVGRSAYRDRPGHPVVLKAEAIDPVRDLARGAPVEVRLWDLIIRSSLTYRSVPIADAAPIDVDTRADLARAREREALEGFD